MFSLNVFICVHFDFWSLNFNCWQKGEYLIFFEKIPETRRETCQNHLWLVLWKLSNFSENYNYITGWFFLGNPVLWKRQIIGVTIFEIAHLSLSYDVNWDYSLYSLPLGIGFLVTSFLVNHFTKVPHRNVYEEKVIHSSRQIDYLWVCK